MTARVTSSIAACSSPASYNDFAVTKFAPLPFCKTSSDQCLPDKLEGIGKRSPAANLLPYLLYEKTTIMFLPQGDGGGPGYFVLGGACRSLNNFRSNGLFIWLGGCSLARTVTAPTRQARAYWLSDVLLGPPSSNILNRLQVPLNCLGGVSGAVAIFAPDEPVQVKLCDAF